MNMLNQDLVRYIEDEVIPRYTSFDKAHREDHVRNVIEKSMNMSVHYDVDENMLYAAAAFHDTGLVDGREVHHLSSGRIVRNDPNLRKWFTPEQIETIAQATEDHRASNGNEPRSIYGKIVAEADRDIEPTVVFSRAIEFGLENYPQLDKEQQWERFRLHIKEKYGRRGYLHLWIPGSPNAQNLELIRQTIYDEPSLRAVFDQLWLQIQTEITMANDENTPS